MTHAMRVMRAQYFLTYAVMGCVLPYLPVFLRARGMQQTQVGYLFVAAGKPPQFVAHDMPERIVDEARRYFGVKSLKLKKADAE